jgi:hypothetical protein
MRVTNEKRPTFKQDLKPTGLREGQKIVVLPSGISGGNIKAGVSACQPFVSWLSDSNFIACI